MKLENIGFYTLSDDRANSSSIFSPLQRCELILGGRCNFKCPYCRGLRPDFSKDMTEEEALSVLEIWCQNRLKNVRFSGGEPTIYKYLGNLVSFCKGNQVERIAISTNGSADISLYEDLFNRGVNDFSISLDSGCCSIGDKMAGGVSGAWERVIETIKYLSKRTYVTVGMVFTEENINQCLEYVLFADSLGVSDIRVIPSAQYNKALSILTKLPEEILNKHKILKYRINNINSGKHVRGLQKNDCNRCWLGLDDMVCVGGYHFPCIIHMREGGDPIGKIGQDIRTQRESWVKNHNCQTDPICIKNCLDVCRDYNNKYEELHDKTS